jgi:serine protease
MNLRSRFFLLTIIGIFLGLFLLGAGAGAIEADTPNAPIDADLPILYGTGGMIPDEVIVEFNSFAEARVAQSVNAFPGVVWEKTMSARPVARYRIIDGSTPFETITRLRRLTNIAEVYPNYRRCAARVPNDPYFQLQKEEVAVSHVPEAWDIETGSAGVLVAVIDTGVDYTHPDLIPNLVLPGINVREDWVPDEVIDDSGHGTAVCGIIGAVGNNGVGVAGINWTVRMLPIRACGGPMLDCDLFDEVEGIDVAREQKANVINLSIGGIGTISVEEKAVTQAYEAGIVIVAAAGNADPGKLYEATGDPEEDRMSLYYPAALPEVIGVGAVNNDGVKPDFSNYGEDILSLMAPGVDIVTTVPEEECYLYTGEGPPYGLASGTSFATPMVSGTAALILSHFPGSSPDDVRDRLEGSAIPMAGPDNDGNGINDYYGHGILNASGALGGEVVTGNQYLRVGLTASPIFPGEVLVLVQALMPLDGPPVVSWAATGGAQGTLITDKVESRPGFYLGRFNPGTRGSISVTVSAFSGGSPVPALALIYLLDD